MANQKPDSDHVDTSSMSGGHRISDRDRALELVVVTKQLSRDVRRLESILEGMESRFHGKDGIEARLTIVSERVSNLQKMVWWMLGASTTVVTGVVIWLLTLTNKGL